MEAKKCDMCKKFYDIAEARNQKVKVYLSPDNINIFGHDKSLDICNECQEKILNMVAKEVI